MGAPPLYLRGGATIPALALFQKALGVDTTVFAFGLPDQNVRPTWPRGSGRALGLG
jgi:hypothetical protein